MNEPNTVHKDCRKAGLLHGIVRDELDPHLVAARLDVLGDVIAAKDADERARRLLSVAYLEVIVNAIVVILDLERLELERHLVIGRNGDAPRALLVRLVIVREVGRLEVSALHFQIAAAQRF